MVGRRLGAVRKLSTSEPRRAGWAVVICSSQAERWAEQNLTHRGYRVYLPLTVVRRRDRVVPSMVHLTTVPLFEGYLFLYLDERESWSPVRQAPGVSSLLISGNRLQFAPTGVIEALQATEAVRRDLLLTEHTDWAPGMACTLREGPFQAQDAVVVDVRHDRARVSLLFMGGWREVLVGIDYLTARD